MKRNDARIDGIPAVNKAIFESSLLLAPSLAVQAADGSRVALVIGNSTYEHTDSLRNPVNDARAIGVTLENLGFTVTRVLDGNKGDILRAVDDFQDRASRKGTEVALFYYSGHGVEYEGVNYIIPVTAEIRDEYALVNEAVSLERITAAMNRAQAVFNMVVLDACRDNPFFKSRSSGNRGLAAMSGGGKESMIVFATSPGYVAQDGEEKNSPFTQAFIKHATVPGLEVSTLMRLINGTVRELTRGKQAPWFNASYTGEFYLGDAEALTNATARSSAINAEIAALETAIARREKAIAAARSEADKIRLEIEQRRARAEEAAKRMQAEQLAEIEKQARQVLEQRKSEDALRTQMESQLTAQRESLTRQARERRTQLDELRRKDASDSDVWEQLEAVAAVNRAVAEINTRFDEAVARMEVEVNALYGRQKAAVKENNPKEPFDTQKEYEDLIAGLTAELEAKRKTELDRRRGEFQTARQGELADLRKQQIQNRKALEGSRFTLGFSATQVKVARFSAEEKSFPMEIRALGKEYSFAVPVSYTLKGNRDAIRKEYYRIYSADQSGGLAGEITCTVTELYPDIWVLRPDRARVVNLLENDAELTRTTGASGEMAVSTAGEVKKIAALVRIESEPGRAQVSVNGKPLGAAPVVYTVPDYAGTVKVEYRWPDGTKRVFAVALELGVNAAAVGSPKGMERHRPVLDNFVRVEGGRFRMGSPPSEAGRDDDEGPQHQVTVSTFYMSRYEVTQREWKAVMGSNPSYFKGDDRPVEGVSWYDAVKYCNRRSEKEGLKPVYRTNGSNVSADWSANGYRLPTEAEWEYAARGGNSSNGYKYAGGHSPREVAWYSSNSGYETHPVGGKAPNELGLYDMSGNVWEWCWDWKGSYSSGSQSDPRGPASGSGRVNRGGSWYDSAWGLRSANRSYFSPGDGDYLGFRLVRREF